MKLEPKKPTYKGPEDWFTGEVWIDPIVQRVQSRGGPIETMHDGDVVHTPAQEWHWHGAAEQHHMTHISITEGGPTFGAHVTDAEYQGSSTEPPTEHW